MHFIFSTLLIFSWKKISSSFQQTILYGWGIGFLCTSCIVWLEIMLTSLKFGYHYTVIVFITCGPMWLLSSGCLLEERTGRRCETLKVSERIIRTIRYRQVGFFLFTAAFFPLNTWGLIWRKSEIQFFYFLAKFLFLSYVFALIGNLELFLSPESLSVISGASVFPVYLNELWKFAFQKLF